MLPPLIHVELLLHFEHPGLLAPITLHQVAVIQVFLLKSDRRLLGLWRVPRVQDVSLLLQLHLKLLLATVAREVCLIQLLRSLSRRLMFVGLIALLRTLFLSHARSGSIFASSSVEEAGVARSVLRRMALKRLLLVSDERDLTRSCIQGLLLGPQPNLCYELRVCHQALHALVLLLLLAGSLLFFALVHCSVLICVLEEIVDEQAHLFKLLRLLCADCRGTSLLGTVLHHQVVQIDLPRCLVRRRKIHAGHVLLGSLNKFSVICQEHHRLVARVRPKLVAGVFL